MKKQAEKRDGDPNIEWKKHTIRCAHKGVNLANLNLEHWSKAQHTIFAERRSDGHEAQDGGEGENQKWKKLRHRHSREPHLAWPVLPLLKQHGDQAMDASCPTCAYDHFLGLWRFRSKFVRMLVLKCGISSLSCVDVISGER